MRKVHKKEPIIHKNMSNHNNKLLVDPAHILQEYPDVEQENTESSENYPKHLWLALIAVNLPLGILAMAINILISIALCSIYWSIVSVDYYFSDENQYHSFTSATESDHRNCST